MSSSKWPRSPSHGKYSRRFCGSSRNCGRSRHQRELETFDNHAFTSKREEDHVRMPEKMARSDPRTLLGRSGLPGSMHPSHIDFRPVKKTCTMLDRCYSLQKE